MSQVVNYELAGTVGIKPVQERVCELLDRLGAEAWAPAPLRVQLATE